MADRKLVVEIVGSEQDLLRSFKKSSAGAKQFDRDLEGASRGALAATLSFRGLGRSLTFAGGGFLAGGGAVVALKTIKNAASDTNEQLSKSRAIFGASSAAIEAWSRTTARSLGISREQALEATGIFGNLFNTVGLVGEQGAQMSETLVKLAADLASFNNANPADVLDAIRSGLIGEAEPLRKFGVLLSETRVQQLAMTQSGKANATALTNQEKALARYTIILNDTKRAQGDFARTQAGQANQERILAAQVKDLEAKLGQLLLPAIVDVTTVLNEATGAALQFGDALGTIDRAQIPLIGKIGSLRAALVQLAPGFGPIAGIASLFGGGAKGVIPATGERPDVFAGLLDGLTKPGQPAAGPFGGARKLPVVKDLSVALQTAEVDARISGSTKRLGAVLVREAVALKDALVNSYGLTAKEKLALKQTLLGITSEIRSIDDAATAEAKAAADAAKARRKAAAEAARQAAERARERAKQLAAARLAARSARQFRALGLTATGDQPVPTVQNLRKQFEALSGRVAASSLRGKQKSLLARIGDVLAGDFGRVTLDVRAKIVQLFDGVRQELGDQTKKTVINQTAFRHTNFSPLLAGLGLAPDELRRVRQRFSMVGPGGTIPQPSPAFGAAGAIVVQADLYVDGQKMASNMTKHQRKDLTRRTTSRRGPYAGRH